MLINYGTCIYLVNNASFSYNLEVERKTPNMFFIFAALFLSVYGVSSFLTRKK